MNKNLTNEEFVNSYLDNELSEIDRLDFENKLLHDSELREEYNFQKDLVEGIKESRRLELKSRLSHVPVNAPLYQTIGFKAVAVASISASVGLGAYFLLNDNVDIPVTEIDLNENQIISIQKKDIPEIPEAITPIIKQEAKRDKKIEVVPQEKPKNISVNKNYIS